MSLIIKKKQITYFCKITFFHVFYVVNKIYLILFYKNKSEMKHK